MFSSGVRAKRGQMGIDHKDIKTTMIYVSLEKSHIREQVEKLITIQLLPPTANE
jgi:site-specific recombinase XerD